MQKKKEKIVRSFKKKYCKDLSDVQTFLIWILSILNEPLPNEYKYLTV